MPLSLMSLPGFQQVPQGFHQLPMLYMTNVPMAFATQLGSGSYNNFRGNNYKGKGKWKKFYGNNSGGQHNGSNTRFYPQGGFSQSSVYDVLNTSQHNGTQVIVSAL